MKKRLRWLLIAFIIIIVGAIVVYVMMSTNSNQNRTGKVDIFAPATERQVDINDAAADVTPSSVTDGQSGNQEPVVGVDVDEDGCPLDGINSWDKELQVCTNPGFIEEDSDLNIAKLAMDYVGSSKYLVMDGVMPGDCDTCYIVMFSRVGDADLRAEVLIKDGEIVESFE